MPQRLLMLTVGLIGAALLMLQTDRVGAQTPVVREEIHKLALNSPTLIALRKAVVATQALPRTSHRNWFFLANIHAFPVDFQTGLPLEKEDQTVPAVERARFWATCQHASEFFLPWHRSELLTFERIVRELSEDAAFALPYWDAFSNPVLPAAFRVAMVDGKPNPLRVENRGFGVNDGTSQVGPLPASLGVSPALMAATYRGGRPNGFGGLGKHPNMTGRAKGFLESPPHDHVHGSLGGLMGDPATAARDPIFYLHHANIDRLWTVWRQNPKHVNPSDGWLTETFVMPSHQNQPEVTFATKGLLETTPLGYRYDNETTVATQAAPQPSTTTTATEELPAAPPVRLRGRGVPPSPAPAATGDLQTLSVTEGQLALGTESVSVEMPLPVAGGKSMIARATGPQTAGTQQMDLVLRGVSAPSNPGVSYLVFVNLPEKPRSGANVDPYFLGVLNSWEIRQAAQHSQNGTPELRFPIADRLSALLKAQSLNLEQLRVSFVRTGLVTSEGKPAPLPAQTYVNVRQIAIEAR